jgi:hypothetical protein
VGNDTARNHGASNTLPPLANSQCSVLLGTPFEDVNAFVNTFVDASLEKALNAAQFGVRQACRDDHIRQMSRSS